MLYTMHHGKIHRATVTQANLEYMGSITIDSELLELSGILPGERVQIVDNNNGNRLETYVIAGERGSGVICLNGAAARKVLVGDTVIIIAYSLMTEEEAKKLLLLNPVTYDYINKDNGTDCKGLIAEDTVKIIPSFPYLITEPCKINPLFFDKLL